MAALRIRDQLSKCVIVPFDANDKDLLQLCTEYGGIHFYFEVRKEDCETVGAAEQFIIDFVSREYPELGYGVYCTPVQSKYNRYLFRVKLYLKNE